MNTNTEGKNPIKKSIDETDGITVKNILDLLEMKQMSVWWNTEAIEYGFEDAEELIRQPDEEKQLSYEQVKQMYPHWFA